LPVISTKKGAEGLPINHLENILIADTENDFIGAIKYLLDSPELYHRISLEGKKMVLKFFDWPELIKPFNSRIMSLFNSREHALNQQSKSISQ
jgi:glycosyltransferase involved in cell wall biosynthesis